jgi:hypothetical protein
VRLARQRNPHVCVVVDGVFEAHADEQVRSYETRNLGPEALAETHRLRSASVSCVRSPGMGCFEHTVYESVKPGLGGGVTLILGLYCFAKGEAVEPRL